MRTNVLKRKTGLSIIVLVVFSLIIATICVTLCLMIMNSADKSRMNNSNKVNEKNNMQIQQEPTIIDFSAYYVIEDNVAVIKIQDNSNDTVMFSCMKVYDDQIPNVLEANFEYTNTFVAPDSGEYLIYAKDVQGNISDSVVVIVEI